MSLWKRAGCQTESKAFEKLIVEESFESPAWVCKTHLKWSEKETEFDQE